MQRDPLCVICLTHNRNIFMQKKKKKCSKQETLKVEAANDSMMKENTKHIYNSSVLLLRCHVAPRSYNQSVEVTTFTHTSEMHRTSALRLNKQDLRLASSSCPIGPESASGCNSCVTAMQRLN